MSRDSMTRAGPLPPQPPLEIYDSFVSRGSVDELGAALESPESPGARVLELLEKQRQVLQKAQDVWHNDLILQQITMIVRLRTQRWQLCEKYYESVVR